MKYVKFLLINVVAFTALLFLFSILFPSQVIISQTVSIRTGKEKIKEKLMASNDWKNWNEVVKDVSGERHNWGNSDTLDFSVENSSHDLLSARFSIYSETDQTVILSWALRERLPWYKPWKKFRAMVVNKDVAGAMESSMNKFKVQIENDQ